MRIVPAIRASSGETLRELALAGQGLVCLSDYVTQADQARGDLVQVLKRDTLDVRLAVNVVHYRNTQLQARVCFLDYVAKHTHAHD